jgi:hypothetical protein
MAGSLMQESMDKLQVSTHLLANEYSLLRASPSPEYTLLHAYCMHIQSNSIQLNSAGSRGLAIW